MSANAMDPVLRATRFRGYIRAVNDGKRAIKSRDDAKLFLEALCEQEDRASCVEKLVAASSGLRALKTSLRSDVSNAFINDFSAPFLRYIADDDVRQLCNGQLLQEILVAVVEPPTFWNALKNCVEAMTLLPGAVRGFASLLLQLLSLLPASVPLDVYKAAEDALRQGRGLLDSADAETRSIAYKIQGVIRNRAWSGSTPGTIKPGGRHDNDFDDFRQIAIFPTTDELLAKERPFYLQAETVLESAPETRVAAHLDNQFRLLREDMLGELRESLSIARGLKKGRRPSLRLKGLVFHGFDCGSDGKRSHASLALHCYDGLPKLGMMDEDQRKRHYAENKTILKHNSFGCLLCSDEILAFATVNRNEKLLARNPSVVLLQVFGDSAVMKSLVNLKLANQEHIEFIPVDTPFFAYDPILKGLQSKTDLPLSDQLLGLAQGSEVARSPFAPESIMRKIKEHQGENLRHVLNVPKDLVLESSQTESLIAGLSQTVSMIQGPPGTGKSFLGALLVKILHENSDATILVLSYTNHALDQFLEDILAIGVPPHQMLRLGGKSTPKTQLLTLHEQLGKHRRSPQSFTLMSSYSDTADELSAQVQARASAFRHLKVSRHDLLDHLQFSELDSDFFYGLKVPEGNDDMKKVGRAGKAVMPTYLIDRWLQGSDAGVFQKNLRKKHAQIWNMDRDARNACYKRWTRDFFAEQALMLQEIVHDYSVAYAKFSNARDEKHREIIGQKRIIGCTTTAAAKYATELSNAKPKIVLVEEAGEILESHILTALSASTEHLVLIGDHKQLRPKVNSYGLTVERGDGYDLNKSLFERLVLSGYPHTTLAKQHRMRPEISNLVKKLTYPGLLDDAKTLNRPHLRGFQSNVVFLNHEHPEVQATKLADRRDEGSKVSRENEFEAQMILKSVRYLAQQGYGTDNQVVLTPYLGQLRLLVEYLKADHDPILNDLDSFDLVKAGLLSRASASASKKSLRISTIDNYQGEESDIVIASLTRSNVDGDIGFMAAPERLNVLLSRARDGLIIIGNATTFRSSRKGSRVWNPFIELLSQGGYIYDGLPVKCERHPQKVALLKSPEDFMVECPDGGCSDPCGTMLSCGKHTCPQRCHQFYDHSKVKCEQIVEDVCSQNHKLTWRCWKQSVPCGKCDTERKKQEKRLQRDYLLETERQKAQSAYSHRLAEVDDEIEHERRLQREHRDQLDREHVLRQRKGDLADARTTTRNVLQAIDQKAATQNTDQKVTGSSERKDSEKQSTESACAEADDDQQADLSPAQEDWEHQKQFENAASEHLDSLMQMIGLESVKQQVLDVKVRIDTCIRQGTDIKVERFGVSLLGNPGTGKTTVARLYAKFLASVGVLPGTTIKETTGSRFASDGVQACKKLIEEVLNAGGGAIIIDEAYQLVSGTNFGGGQVLDFLLAEVENLTGKIVFILAGYNKPMEKLFAHNPGLPSRFPHTFQFEDYEDDDLRRILQYQLEKRYEGRMKVEDGLHGLYCRIAARRVGYGRGREGFGNARAVENALASILSRQAKRLAHHRRQGKTTDDMLLTQEDLIGPEPSAALEGNKSWEKLRTLTGLKAVKLAVKALFDSIQSNYERELEEQPLFEFNLNRVFLGSPGTGKTTVAKLYGQVLAGIGFLSSGEVVVKNPSDFVGDVLGASEKTTKGILASTVGKVLVIDEAYGLHGGGTSGGDPYKTAVIDTIVAEIQSVPGEDRCVLLIGYRNQMEAMFQSVNPGLTRRFPLSEAFEFEDFTDDELKDILDMKLKQQALNATDQAKKVASDVLKRARNRPNFGNAGEVDILLNGAKSRLQQRRSAAAIKGSATLEAVDMDPDFDRGERATTNVRLLFRGVVGCEELIDQLEGYQRTVANMKARDMDPREQIAFNFLFRGPPGTGKTTTARKMGKIYYDMGFLATAEVIETSATDLIGEFVGQTGPKTQKLLEKALGKVLFIDEAYRLAEGHFAKEAMDEIVDCLTKPAFAQKLVVILAGYDADINRLMSINPGLTSRFPETVSFKSLDPQSCFDLFASLLKKHTHLDSSLLESPTSTTKTELLQRFKTLASLNNWANARDVGTLAKAVLNKLMRSADPRSKERIPVDDLTLLLVCDEMITERSNRSQTLATNLVSDPLLPKQMPALRTDNAPPPPTLEIQTTQAPPPVLDAPPEEPPPEEPANVAASDDARDDGVSNEVWSQLSLDKQAAATREREHMELLAKQAYLMAEQAKEDQEAELKRQERQSQEEEFQRRRAMAEEAEAARLAAEEDAARRRFELERLRREQERRQLAEHLARIERERQKAEEERRKEQAKQVKLRTMGVCPVGYRWIKQAGGYRCEAGGHFVSDAELE